MQRNIQTDYYLERVGAVKLREEALVVDFQCTNTQFLVETRSYYRKKNGKVCWVTESQHWVSFNNVPVKYEYEEKTSVSWNYGEIEEERLQFRMLTRESREMLRQIFPQFNFQNILERKECINRENVIQ